MKTRFFQLLLIGAAVCIGSPPVMAASKSAKSPARQSTIVVIDAGHGGFDRGGIPRQVVAEKTMALDVALRLRAVLQSYGYRVVMTRDSDVFVSLPGRVAIANSYSNAIFVCIHFNSSTRAGANGIETYFYSRESLALASAIHYNLTRTVSTPNRGVRRRGYYVLRKTRVPAVLVECGFLTNPTEARSVQDSRYRQRLAESIGHGVQERASVSSRPISYSTAAAEEAIPLQPFIDQTRVTSSKSHAKRSSRKSSKSKSSKKKSSSSSSTDETPSKKKKSTKETED